MGVTLLGTGAADGWPNPWCSCASCADARARGEQRRPTSALVDRVLLLDLPPGTPPDGISLAGVRTVLITHDHPDHCSPFALLWRRWAHLREPLTVVGPSPVLEACRPWLGPDDPVTLREVGPGDSVELDGYLVRALGADHEVPTVLYDLTGPDADRLLYATDTGPLPEATPAAVRERRSTSSCWSRPSATSSGTGRGTWIWRPSRPSSGACAQSERSPTTPTWSPST